LLHPFSPKGKLVHLGLEGLEATNRLVQAARTHFPDCVIGNQIYRVALSEDSVEQLKRTANVHPHFATWLDPLDIENCCGTKCHGGLLLSNGCGVVHVPSYLKGLWCACQEISKGRIHWCLDVPNTKSEWTQRLSDFHTVVFSAGSGLFQDLILGEEVKLPIQLVRGQSVIMSLNTSDFENRYTNQAILCGKYITPMPDENCVMVGATHEYVATPLDCDSVVKELMHQSYALSPCVWDHGSIEKITCGYRVQSKRGKYGRMPIIGKYEDCQVHGNSYLFTGLSSRGLIYHGIYGDFLTSAIIEQNEDILIPYQPDILWWKD
jgi:glycine/D-amino acid oxidase-like deaminating enzyme